MDILKILLYLAVVGALVWGSLAIYDHEEHQCTARGGNYTVTGYVPVVTGKSVSVQPVYSCVMPSGR